MKNSKKVPATKTSKGASPNNAKTPQRNPNAKSKETSASKELKQSQNISPVNQSKDENVNIQETDLDQKSKKSPNKDSTKSPIKAETPSSNNERNNNPAEKVISTRAYLEETVVSVVQEGMLELARTKPDNPLEFLGNFILQRAKQNE